MRKLNLLQTPILCCLAKGNFSVYYWRYMGLLTLGRQIHAPEEILRESCAFVIEMAIARPQRHKSLRTDYTQAELIKTGGRTICYETQNLIVFIWNQEEWLSTERSLSFYLSIWRAIKEILVIIEARRYFQPQTQFYQISWCQC